MAIATLKTEEFVLNSGNSYTVNGSGSNKLMLVVSLGSNSTSGDTTYTELSVNSTETLNQSAVVDAAGIGSSPYTQHGYGIFDDGDTWPTTGNAVATITSGYANEALFIAELSGVDQTTPIASGPQTVGGTSQAVTGTFASWSSVSGDWVYMICLATAGQTWQAPSDVGADSWVAGPTGTMSAGGLTAMACYILKTTEDHDAITTLEGETTTASDTISASLYVVTADTGGGTSIPTFMHYYNQRRS